MRALRPWLLSLVALVLGVMLPGVSARAQAPAVDPVVAAASPAAGAEARGQAEEASSPSSISPGGIPALEQAWFTPSYGLPERAKQVRSAADRLGLENLDAAARAVLLGKLGADRREEAEAAVVLAPDLPGAHAALAEARWGEQDSAGAVAAALDALRRIPGHLEASLWTTATAGWFLYVALIAGGFGYIALRGMAALPLAARDLGDSFEPTMTTPARLALVGSAVLVPPALGEGPVGALAVLFLLGLLYGEAPDRRALVAAALFAFVALQPLAREVGRSLVALGSDPLAEATWSSERGFLDPVESERLAARGERDTLSLHAIARRSRRAGDLGAAEARFLALLEAEPANPVLLTDLGNLRYHQGRLDDATGLYQQATHQLQSPVIWFNLAQAHGRNIEVTQHENALNVAQDLDRALVGKLAERIGDADQGFVADLPIPTAAIRSRLRADPGSAFADQARRAWAPGWIGLYPGLAAGCFALLFLLAGHWRKRLACSQWCARCAAIAEGHAGVDAARDALCDDCRKAQSQRSQPRWQHDGDPAPRWPRALRMGFGALGTVLPGVGLTVSRPLSAWAGLTGAALAGSVWWYGTARIPDPLAMGAAAGWATLLLGGLGLGTYLLAVWRQTRGGR